MHVYLMFFIGRMRKFENLVLLWVGACTALACLLSPTLAIVEGATLPAGFSESVVFSGLTKPTAVRFSPDGRVFVAEKSGLIKVFATLSATTPTVFHDLQTNVHNFWDRGLMGLELHPNFPTVPSVYVIYTYDKDPTNSQVPRWGTPGAASDGCPTPPGPTTDGCVVSGRVSRLEASAGTSVSTGIESVLVEGWGQQYPSHSMDTVMFGADGALYASAGDGASFTFADYGQAGTPLNPLGDPPVGIGGVQTPPTAEGGSTRSQSLRRVSGPTVLNGTLIRVDPFTGAALADNPLSANTDPNARRIVGYGFRNPFRFTFRPGTNELWIGDVGNVTWEEIDRISNPLTSPVRNFGWPCYEGAAAQVSFQALGLNICKNLYTSGSATPPYFAYNHSQKVVAGETCPTGSSSISGLAFNQGGTYPTVYQGALFFSDFSRKCIWSMFAAANGLPDPATRATFAADAANPVDLQIGPGGDVFYVDFDGGAIRRIQYTSGNQAPNAVIQAMPLSGPTPLTVTFDGSASSDPNAGDTLTYSWDLNGDGLFGDALTAQTSFTYTQVKPYNVQLKVTDNQGAFDVARVLISAGNSPPTAFIDTPVTNTPWQVGQSITFSGHATDSNEVLPSSAFSWEIILHHCPSNCHTHPIQSFSGVTTASFSAPDHDYPSHLEVKLTVTDAGGLTATKSVLLDPQTVTLNFVSTPSGLELVVGSSNAPTPFTRTVILESANSVSAATPQPLGGITYYFASWSDGGNQSHLIVGTTSATYTATYSLTADTTLPTMPSSLTGSVLSGTQISLSWPASTDNVGVTGYELERCEGVGCTNFALIATPTTTSYVDTNTTPGTSYSYRVRARDAVGNFSTYSSISTSTTAPPTTNRTTLFTDPFNRADNADLGAAYTDSYTGFTTGKILSQRLVPSAVGVAAVEHYTGGTTPNDQWSEVTIGALTSGVVAQVGTHVRLTNPTTFSGYRCFAAINQTNKAGIRRFTAGVSTSIGTNDTTTVWGVGDTLRCEIRGTTIKLYRVVGTVETLLTSATDATYASGTTGIYASVAAGGAVTNAQISRFSMGGYSLTTDTTPPTAPGSPTASAPSGIQINLSWPAATDNVGVTSYQVERCPGVGCTTFALIASPSTTGYLDTGLTPGTSYSYRVRAQDATGNVSPYSPIITATTLTSAANRTTLFTDPFNRADNTDLGADYAGGYTGSTTGKIVSQHLLPTAVGTNTVERYTGVTTPANQWCEFTIGTFTGAQGADLGCSLQMSAPPTVSLYLCRASINATNKASLRRFDAGVSNDLGNNTTVVWGPGDVGRCEREGTALRFYRVVGTAETLLLSTTDATYSSGSTGPFAAVNTGGTLTNAQISRFSMGGFGAASAATIAFDAASSSAAGNTTNTISWSHTVGNGTNRFLAVCMQARDTVAGDVAVTTVTANGFPLTKVRADLRTDGGSSFGTELWYLATPGIGPYTIAVTWAGALSGYGVGSATSYFGVNQVAPIDAQAGSGGTGTTLSTAITTVATHALITDCAIAQSDPLTIGVGQTSRVNRTTTGTVDAVGVSTVNDKMPAGTETMDWTQVAAQNWAISAVSLRPAP
jgi:glucose/arabinose dehydrogenase